MTKNLIICELLKNGATRAVVIMVLTMSRGSYEELVPVEFGLRAVPAVTETDRCKMSSF